jgi:hypothetical protein
MRSDITEPEKRATELVYERDFGSKLAYPDIPDDVRAEILLKVRARAMEIEQFVTHNMLVRKIGEQRWNPARFSVPALITLILMALAIGIGIGVLKLLHLV